MFKNNLLKAAFLYSDLAKANLSFLHVCFLQYMPAISVLFMQIFSLSFTKNPPVLYFLFLLRCICWLFLFQSLCKGIITANQHIKDTGLFSNCKIFPLAQLCFTNSICFQSICTFRNTDFY